MIKKIDKMRLKNTPLAIFFVMFVLFQVRCKKLIEVETPVNSISNANVYESDATAAAVLTDIYAELSDQNLNAPSLGLTGLSVIASLSADELELYDKNNLTLVEFYRNDLNDESLTSWSFIYPIIFRANDAIEGLTNSISLTPSVRNQLMGEAKFIRAFCYFYLVNLYGDIPLAVSTNYQVNAALGRSPESDVYQQIIVDLNEAKDLLSEKFLSGDVLTNTVERVRPTKWSVSALLARVYLYTGNYIKAETESSAVINNTMLFGLDSLNGVFIKNSNEAIWQLQPVGFFLRSNTGDGKIFVLPATGPNNGENPIYLSNNLIESFESNDHRKKFWVDSVVAGGVTYHFPFKYKIGNVDAPPTEYIMVLRLGEQYLIRAEARTQMNNISGAQDDLNIIRARAVLPNTSANDQATLLAAVMHERQTELFTEWGNRWFDLKRSNMVDQIMSIVTPQKGGTWNLNWQLYPIPLSEMRNDTNLEQNDGY